MDWLTNWIFDLLYGFQKTICYIIDFIREIFYTLAGIDTVNIDGEETDLLSHFILSDTVKTTFFYIFLIAIILLVIFVIIAIIRSEYANGENKRSKGQILAKSFQSFAIFLMVPFILIAGITLTNVVMGAINASMNPYVLEAGGTASLGGQILITSGQFAYIGDPAIREEIEMQFLTGQLDYFDLSVVSQYYSIRDIDFLVGILGSIVIMVMFVMSAVTFIQRIFDIVLLFIISPVSVSTIPVDDGNRFRIWKEMTIAKVLGAYGIILSMNLFFIIIPQVQAITFFNDSFKNGIVKILFLIGGAFAVTKANIVIAQLTGNSAGGNETAQLIANMRTGGHIVRTTAATGATIGGAILGGKRFVDTKKTTRSSISGLKSSFGAMPSKTYLNKATEPSKLAKYGGMPTRIATMPIGMIKDLTTGGIVGMTKNIIPRAKNVVKGDSFINHAQGKSILIKEQNNADNTEKHEG